MNLLGNSATFFRVSPLFRRIRSTLLNALQLKDLCKAEHHVLNSWLSKLEIDTLIDVGANIGQFGIDIRSGGYRGAIHSFEPSSKAYSILEKTLSKKSDWYSYNLALGEESKIVKLFVTKNEGLSSSLLNMTQLHVDAYPGSEVVQQEEISVERFETIQNKHSLFSEKSNVAVKLDVQGAELRVLQGFSGLLSQVKLVYCEASSVEFYRGQPLLDEVIEFLVKKGFTLRDVVNIQRKDKVALQFELLLTRK